MELFSARTGGRLASRVRVARSMISRMVGLLNRSRFEPGEALVLPGCNAVHTCFMRFPIDVVFVNAAWTVVALQPRMPAWRFSPVIWQASRVIELPPGTLERTPLAVGEPLELVEASVTSLDMKG